MNPELRDVLKIIQTTLDSYFWPQSNPEVESINGDKKTPQDGSDTPMCQQTRSRIHEGCICEQWDSQVIIEVFEQNRSNLYDQYSYAAMSLYSITQRWDS